MGDSPAVSFSMFDTDKVYFHSTSAFELTLYALFKACTSEKSFSAHVSTKTSSL